MDRLIWNEDIDMVYGIKQQFANESDFANIAKNQHLKLTNKNCNLSNIRVKSCISTGEGLDAETITPLEETDIEINTYYIADVERVEL